MPQALKRQKMYQRLHIFQGRDFPWVSVRAKPGSSAWVFYTQYDLHQTNPTPDFLGVERDKLKDRTLPGSFGVQGDKLKDRNRYLKISNYLPIFYLVLLQPLATSYFLIDLSRNLICR